MTDLPVPTVETGWLAANLGASGLIVVDGSWRMPGAGFAREDYERRHIPGAVFFDIDEIADKSTKLPHMLPSPDEFDRAMSDLGIGSHARIVVYDDAGLFSAARVWWTFRVMGHEAVSVLNGGLPKWIAEKRPVEAGAVKRHASTFRSKFRADRVCSADDVRASLVTGDAVILDARPAGRFEGRDPEPRPGLRCGHMPGAASLPHGELVADGALKPADELERIFSARGVSGHKPVVATCGSGVSAAVLALALERLGRARHAVYDGSWTEWGDSNNDPARFPVATGA
ncbi:MAG: 3-mercaptopyruvate sulfurtransferase [Pseudomonadota bacterium]|nr:3-mercaptopyruvate sulfurtransferase [Pseudomonadota bacterium]